MAVSLFWISCSQAEHRPHPTGQAADAQEESVTASKQTLAIARLKPGGFSGERSAPRTFDVAKGLSPHDLDVSRGFRLRLNGRTGANLHRCNVSRGVEY